MTRGIPNDGSALARTPKTFSSEGTLAYCGVGRRARQVSWLQLRMPSDRCCHFESEVSCRAGHSPVICHDRPQFLTDNLCGGHVDCIVASQLSGRCEGCSAVEQIGAEHKLVQPGELSSSLPDRVAPPGEHGSNDLDAGQRTRHEGVVRVLFQETPECFGLGFLLNQLHNG